MLAYLVEEVPADVKNEAENEPVLFRSEFDYARARKLSVSKSDPAYLRAK